MIAEPSPASSVDRLVLQQVGAVVGVVAVDVDAEVDLAERLLHRLAHLADGDRGQLLAPLGVQLADAAHELGALLDARRSRPLLVRLVRQRDGRLELVVRDRRVVLDGLAGGRIDDRVIGSSSSCSPPLASLRLTSASASGTTVRLLSQLVEDLGGQVVGIGALWRRTKRAEIGGQGDLQPGEPRLPDIPTRDLSALQEGRAAESGVRQATEHRKPSSATRRSSRTHDVGPPSQGGPPSCGILCFTRCVHSPIVRDKIDRVTRGDREGGETMKKKATKKKKKK